MTARDEVAVLRDGVAVLRDGVAALRDVFTLAYEAGRADGWEAARADVLCLPPRVSNPQRVESFPARHLTLVKP